tara:strand:- start:446 stop:805 length:360 start_codon:yes stop_codon:yes gene_type:complete
MAGLALLILTLLISACQTVETKPLTTLDIRKQEAEVLPVKESIPVVPGCGQKDKMKALLMEKFREEPLIWGTAKGGAVITIFAGPGAHWTMTRTINDTLCLMMVGDKLSVMSHAQKVSI